VFSAVAMKRLSTVVLERDQRAVLRTLGRLGVIHLIRTAAGPETAPLPPADRSAELGRCDEFLARIDSIVRRLEIDLLADGAAEPAELLLGRVEIALRPVEERAMDLLQHEQQLRQQLGHVKAVQQQVLPFESLDVPLDMLGGSAFLHFAIGSLPAGSLEAVTSRIGPNVLLTPLPQVEEGIQPVVVITSRRAQSALEDTLQKAGFTRATLCGEEGATAASLASRSRQDRGRVESLLAKAYDELAAFRPEAVAKIGELRRAIVAERRILEAQQEFPRTESTVLVRGWVPARAVPDAQAALQQVTQGRFALTAQDPCEVPDEEVPVLLGHSWLLRPFEMIVSGYGLPQYRELEPTLFVAISYVLMFGMMFGDAGHGAVLVLLGLGMILRVKSPKIKDIGVLLALAGLSSVVFGLLYGECFGFNEKHGWPLPALWTEPLAREGSMSLMATSIGIGIGLISLGLVLNMINKFRRGDVVGGLLDKFGVAGAVFYWGVLALALKYAAVREMGLVWAAIVLVVVLPLAGIVLKEPLEYILARRPGHKGHGHAAEGGSFLEAVLGSLVEAFETIIAYVANTISFIRLAAYAMSHAAILMATFAIAAQVHRAVEGPGGTVLWVVVIIGGNVMAILLEGLVALVQAVRLEYYEFFGKFFSGSGRAFEPFRISAGSKGMSGQQ
jgi:V/A-type H+-transporting ATPase subunit I